MCPGVTFREHGSEQSKEGVCPGFTWVYGGVSLIVVGGPPPRVPQNRSRSLLYLVRNNMKMTFVSLRYLMCDNVV